MKSMLFKKSQTDKKKKTSSQSSDKKKKGSSLTRSKKDRAKSTTVSEKENPITTSKEDVQAKQQQPSKMKHAFSELTPESVTHIEEEEGEEEKVTVNLPVICRAEAICAYDPDQMGGVDDDITFLRFEKGEMIDVVEQDESGWWEGIVNGEWGIFPGSYVKIVELYEVVEDEKSQQEEQKLEEENDLIENEYLCGTDDAIKRISSSSLDQEGQDVDDMLTNLISAYESDTKKQAPSPRYEEEDDYENVIEENDDYDRDSFFNNEGTTKTTPIYNLEENEIPSNTIDEIINQEDSSYFPETDYVFGSSVNPEFHSKSKNDDQVYDDDVQEEEEEEEEENDESNENPFASELENLRSAAEAKEKQMNDLLLKHAKTARQLDEYIKGEQQNKISQELDEAQEEITSLKLQLSDLESQRTTEKENTNQITRKLQFTQNELEKLRKLQQEELKARSDLEEEKLCLKNELSTLQSQLELSNQKLQQSENEIQHLRKQVESAMEKNSESQLKSLQNRLNEMQDILHRKDSLVQTKDARILQLETINSSLVLKIQTLTDDSKGKSDRQDDSVRLLEEQVKELTEQKNLLNEKLREKAKNEIKLVDTVEKLQKNSKLQTFEPQSHVVTNNNEVDELGDKNGMAKSISIPALVTNNSTDDSSPRRQQPSRPQSLNLPRGTAPLRSGGRPRARVRGATRGAVRGAPAARGAPTSGNVPPPTGSIHAGKTSTSAPPSENGTASNLSAGPRGRPAPRSRATFNRPLGPQGRPVQRRLITKPSTAPPAPTQTDESE